MDPAIDFDTLYNTRLLPAMGRLQTECRRADNWGIAALSAFVLAAIIGFLGLQMNYVPGYGIYCAVLIAVAVVSLYKYGKNNDRFTEDYKKYVIQEIISNLCPGAVYKPGDCIPQRDYKRSGLYRRYYDYYSGNDYMEATVNGASFRYSELWTQYDDGTSQVNIFRGLFFVIRISDAYAGGTYIWPVEAEQLPASIYDAGTGLCPCHASTMCPPATNSLMIIFVYAAPTPQKPRRYLPP